MKPIVGVGGVLPSTYTLNGNEGDYASIEGSYQLFIGIYSRRLRISPDEALGIISMCITKGTGHEENP